MVIAPHYDAAKVDELVNLSQDQQKLESMEVDKYVDLYVK